ncbi:MAG TPA: hypothetical protein VJ994_08925, partial [Paracoccaceae bacterium]|nr:hypothetical protein [Paracoccaceae bacterium]
GTTDGGTTDGGTTDDGTTDGGTTDGGTTDGGTTDGGTTDGGTTDGGTTDGGTTDGGTTDGGTTGSDPADGFDIDFAFSGFDGQYAGLVDAFTNAAAILEGIILADLPDMTFWSGETIDDVLISASLISIDGSYGVLGRAGPTAIRSDIKLPSKGMMEFDTADATRLDTEGKWEAVIIHEMLHVLGMGTLWGDGLLDLATGEGTSDARFTGVNGNAAYIAGVQDGSIPSNDAGYLKGIPLTSDGAHFRENALDRELMTPMLDANPTLEAITIAALEDMGYDTVWDDVTRDDDLVGTLPADDLLFA